MDELREKTIEAVKMATGSYFFEDRDGRGITRLHAMLDQIHDDYKQAGYVRLSPDQSLPDVWVRDIPSGKLVQEDMWNKSWRKVEL